MYYGVYFEWEEIECFPSLTLFIPDVFHYSGIKDKADREQRGLLLGQEMGENLALQWHYFFLAQPKVQLN